VSSRGGQDEAAAFVRDGRQDARRPDDGVLVGTAFIVPSTVPASSDFELLHGIHRARGAARAQRQAFVEHLLAELQAIPITQPVARIHAGIWSELAQRGEPIGAHDLWIAATALAHGLDLATRNDSHFRRIAGLRVIAAPSSATPAAGRPTASQSASWS
jgi:predicted nucleic acid-binding protein